MNPETARANRLWATLLVEELIRNGVDFFCVSPGSRSTPLVAAISENPKAKPIVHYDERGTAFAALGYARATGRAAAWITTSGTAVANGLPAVVEASTDGVPMLLLTADRPPELRQTGANQTIIQPDIFGEYTRWKFDLPAPDLSVDPASVLTTVDQAVYRARRPPKGPVHLNLMFREPFLPAPNTPEAPTGLDSWQSADAPYTRYDTNEFGPASEEVGRMWEELCDVGRGLIVAGRLESKAQGESVIGLSEALGWPVLPDVGSQVRLGSDTELSAPHYDALLSSEQFAGAHAPEAVLHFGGRALSKRLEQFLARVRPENYVVVRENPFRLDPGHQVTWSVEAGIPGFCKSLVRASEEYPATVDADWAASWRTASEKVAKGLRKHLDEPEKLSEPFVARFVSRHVPAGHGLVLASSMPVRDFDTYAVSDGPAAPVVANRGASGIDGTVAMAAGSVRGSGKPATLLIGDLALLHDLNSLAMLKELPVVVVALNNDGGGIFSFLPVSQQRAGLFEPYFGTPHGLCFENAAAMFGLDYDRPRSVEEFAASYAAAASRETATLIEVETDREENVALHRELLRVVSGDSGG